jgi:hypothetical protein
MSFITDRKDGKNPMKPRGVKSSIVSKTKTKKTSKKRKERMLVDVPSVSKKEENRWMAEEDLRTLQRAKEIEKNAARLRNARIIAKKQMEALKEVSE